MPADCSPERDPAEVRAWLKQTTPGDSTSTLVRVAPSASLHRGSERVALEQIVPGSEVVIRTLPAPQGTAEGSALPGRMATAPMIDASDVNVVWVPSASLR